MAFIWRRRSTTIVKLVAIFLAIWFCIAFLVYTDDSRQRAQEGSAGSADGIAMPLKYAAAEAEAPGAFEEGNGFGVNGNVHARGRDKYRGQAAEQQQQQQQEEEEADVPPTVSAKQPHKANAAHESIRKNVVVLPEEKPPANSVLKRKEDDQNVLDAPADNAEENPGEMGKPVQLPKDLPADVKKAVDDGWTNNAFNQYASDLISVHRSLPDPRDAWCKDPDRYLTNLPVTDVIICFHNEAWSVLVRTVHSVLDRSPPHLIGQVILVDDYSNMPHLKKQLEDYFANQPKVKIVRGAKREGLIRARLLGARYAKSQVITYLDSHCECTEGWLEPLLDRIARDRTTVVCPVIDVIDDATMEFHYRDSSGVNVGGFDWNLQFSWHAVPEHEKRRHNNSAEPVYSPTMAGGLFSIDREFFERLGTYDSGFDIWGGENLELSFKTWMCGGTLEIVPCSHVGHIFRKRSPYKWRQGVNVLKKNSVRLAEVWMDEYAQYYYQRIGNDKGDFGDVSSRKALRENLECKSFKWYLDNIYPELFIPGDSVAHGEIKNLGYGGRTCLDSPAHKRDMKKPVGLYPCHRQGGNQIANRPSNMCLDAVIKLDMESMPVIVFPCHHQGGNQYWMLSKAGEIRRDDACLDYAGKDVMIFGCHGSKGNQFWKYREDTKHLHHGASSKCLAISHTKDKLIMEECNENAAHQKWVLENYDASKL